MTLEFDVRFTPEHEQPVEVAPGVVRVTAESPHVVSHLFAQPTQGLACLLHRGREPGRGVAQELAREPPRRLDGGADRDSGFLERGAGSGPRRAQRLFDEVIARDIHGIHRFHRGSAFYGITALAGKPRAPLSHPAIECRGIAE